MAATDMMPFIWIKFKLSISNVELTMIRNTPYVYNIFITMQVLFCNLFSRLQ